MSQDRANAFYALIEALSSCGGPCAGDTENADLDAPIFLRIRRLRLAGVEIPVFIGQPKENLGFPGGVNSWLRLFLPERGWDGVWILNPDTWPAPDGLTELIAFAVKRQKGMSRAGSCFPTVGHRFVARPQVA